MSFDLSIAWRSPFADVDTFGAYVFGLVLFVFVVWLIWDVAGSKHGEKKGDEE